MLSAEIQRSQGSVWTPDMTPKTMHFDLDLTKSVIGYDFTLKDAERALGRSRIGTYSNGSAVIPRYRHDIIHPVDLVEEVALGFGIQLIKPQSLQTSLAGSFSKRQTKLNRIIETMVGLGLTEVWNLSLTNVEQVSNDALKVDDSKSQSFEYLRSDLIGSLLYVLGSSTHQEYPQKIFEQAPVFGTSRERTVSSVCEEEHVAGIVADSEANYSMIRSMIDALLRLILDENTSVSLRSVSENTGAFAAGRAAIISISNKEMGQADIGIVGEVSPQRTREIWIEGSGSWF